MTNNIKNNKNKKILLTGGGTGGSVAPLLAIVEEFKIPPLYKGSVSPKGVSRGGGKGRFDFLWLGTKNGPEREMVEREGIEFKAIASGKFRRYFSWRNFIDLFLIKLGFFQSFFIILKWRPDIVLTAGSFVSVPVVWAAWLLRVPILAHQQDARAGLANKLMAPFARVVTVTFEESLKDYGKKAVWTGNSTRRSLEIKNQKSKIKNQDDLPVVLVVGGGTGAMAINELAWEALPKLTKFYQIIHVTGKGKVPSSKFQVPNYKSFEFLSIDQMAEAYTAADVVVSRAGMGVLTELSYLAKPAIIIPLPDSHQEDNARIFKEKNAAIVLNQKELAGGQFMKEIEKLVNDKSLRKRLGENIGKVIKRGAGERIVEIIKQIILT